MILVIRRFFIICALSMLAIGGGTRIAIAESDFDELIIFGDSLSDTGNIAALTFDLPPPYFNNRISDGPVLVDYLAAELGVNARASFENNGDNFAVLGGNILGNDLEDLSAQVGRFLNREAQAKPENLYFIMMGGNDLRDMRSISSESLAQAQIELVLNQLDSQLNRLYQAGARTFLIANVPNIGRIPETLMRRGSDPNISQRAEAYVRAYNQALAQRLNVFSQRPGVSLALFDLFAELERLLDNAPALGFTQTEVGCFQFSPRRFEPDCESGARFDRFVFFDNIHPTGKANRLASAALIDRIPLPNFAEPSDTPNISAIIQLLLLD